MTERGMKTICGSQKRLLLAVIFLLAALPFISPHAQRSKLTLSEDAEAIRQAVEIDRIKRDMARLTALESRIVGYPGADSAAKYVFDRFHELGLEEVESRSFSVATPVERESGRLTVSSNGKILRQIDVRSIWPNLARTSFIPNGLKRRVQAGETLVSLASDYRVSADAIVNDPRNASLRDQRADGLDNDNDGYVDDADPDGEITPVEGAPIFIPTGGLQGRLAYGGTGDLSDFDGQPIGGFWVSVQPDDTLESVARRHRVTTGAILDDILNLHLSRSTDGIDNDGDGEIDEDGEIDPLSTIAGWASDGIDNDEDGNIDETADEDPAKADEASIFIPQGAVALIDFNASSNWINAAMLGAQAVLFIEPEDTLRGAAENKFLTVPASIPRFWIGREDAEFLLKEMNAGAALDAQLTCDVRWESRQGQNITGLLRGSDPSLRDELIVIQTYYDSMSVVPSLAPGAQTTSGIASMMELIRLLSQPEFRPSRSALFLATGGHFSGLSGMRAFMEGLSQDNVEAMRELRRDLNSDAIEFSELGRKIALSIDRGYLVEFPPSFFHRVEALSNDLKSVELSLEDLSAVQSRVDRLKEQQRAFKEDERKRKTVDLSKNRDRQEFTDEERALLDTGLARAEFLGIQTAQFLKSIAARVGELKAAALQQARETERRQIIEIALPLAKVDVWAMDAIAESLAKGEYGGEYPRGETDSLLPLYLRAELLSSAPQMPSAEIPGYGEIDPNEALASLAEPQALEDWEIEKGRIARMYVPDKILGRHLTALELGRIRRARATLHERETDSESYLSNERRLLNEALESAVAFETSGERAADIEAMDGLLDGSFRDAKRLLEMYLTEEELAAMGRIYEEMRDPKAKEPASREAARYLEIARRRIEWEPRRIEQLLTLSESDMLKREFRHEEFLALRRHLSKEKMEALETARRQLFAEHEEKSLLEKALRQARNDILELNRLAQEISSMDRAYNEDEKRLLRNNLLTMRNSRVRNVHKRVERLSRIDTAEYSERIGNVIQSLQLQQELGQYYQSLVVSLDLSTQSKDFGVFYKGWFYDDNREFSLRREYAPIGNKLSEYALNANLKRNLETLRKFPDDHIKQAILTSQWAIADRLADLEELEGKTLETLVFNHYDTLKTLGGVSRLMKLQFEDMREKGEPSKTMLKDIDYIRKEAERFVRNDIRETRRRRKSTKRLFARVEKMLALKNVPIEELTEDEISDLRALTSMAGIRSETNFVNAISASGGNTWQTYIPGKIAFDSEVATLSGKTGIAFATVNDGRVYTDTPLDTYDRLNFENLSEQVQTLASLMVQMLRDPKMPTSARVGNFYVTLTGRVVEYDARESAVPQTPVQNAVVVVRRRNKTMMGVRGDLTVLGNQKGKYVVAGLAMEGRATRRPGGRQTVEAYVLDEDSGDIVYAPDLGEFGDKIYPRNVAVNRRRVGANVVAFPCVSVTIYDLVDQRYLRTLTSLQVFDAFRDAPPERYGVSAPWSQPMVSAAEPIALVYSEPGARVKISMTSGLLGKLLLLVKATETNVENPTLYTGEGYLALENGSIRVTPYVVVQDMWRLDEARIGMYRRYGISNQRLEELHGEAARLLEEAEKLLAANQYSAALKKARAGWGNESIAYPDVKATGNDVIRGVMFYLFLLLPFSLFGERLIFSATNINKRIIYTFGIFLAVFFFLSRVHPAFEIAETAFIILIAFIILALTIVVISIILRKFNEQLEQMRREKSRIYKADVGRLSASAAAFSLGISNMRKRRGRTLLTCATLIALTFTVISFTSVRTEIRAHSTRIPGVTPSYQGALIRDQYWRPLEEPVVEGTKTNFSKSTIEVRADGETYQIETTNVVAPRAWYESASVGNQSAIRIESLMEPDKAYNAAMLVGMTPEEKRVTRIDSKLAYGRWFEERERDAYVCVLPKGMADSLGITEEAVVNGTAQVRLLGADFTVVGVLGIDFKELRDLDGEELTPVDYTLLQQQQQRQSTDETLEGELQKYQHLPPDQIAVIPYQLALDSGGNVKSVAVNMQDLNKELPEGVSVEQKIDAVMAPVMKRSGLDFFVGKGRNVYLYSSIGGSSTEQMSNLFIPILIAALIVLNTMLGAVYERVREIGIYSAVGLAPVHIAFLFMAEACVYAVLGAVVGYLIGQATAWTLVQTGWLAGLTLNYSARSTVYATMIVMFVVLASTLYPAIKAGRMAVPDIERKWRLPDPDGDEWNFDLPFTVLGEEALGLNIFMRDYFEAHADESASDFYADNVTFKRECLEGESKERFAIEMMIWLAPYDLGVSQRISLQTSPVGGEEEDLCRIHLTIYRESGEIASWKRVNRRFLNLIRKQLLIWRTFNVELRGEFHARGREESQPAFASD